MLLHSSCLLHLLLRHDLLLPEGLLATDNFVQHSDTTYHHQQCLDQLQQETDKIGKGSKDNRSVGILVCAKREIKSRRGV